MLKLVETEPIAEQATFEDFWALYPRHVAKKDALKAWGHIDPELYVAIVIAVYHWRRVWALKESQFVPYPASWLRGERWDDELPSDAIPMHASHAQARPPEQGKKSEMPQFVKEMIRRMKKA